MLEITICAYKDVANLLKINNYDAIISIKNPNKNSKWSEFKLLNRQKKYEKHCKNVLCMDFLDCDDQLYNAPREHHINSIIQFAKKISQNNKILIHCMAGISRSSACAMILLQEHGLNSENAYNEIIRVRPQSMPNKYMLKLYEKLNFERYESLITEITNQRQSLEINKNTNCKGLVWKIGLEEIDFKSTAKIDF